MFLELWDGESSRRSIRLTAGTLNACARQEVHYMPHTHMHTRWLMSASCWAVYERDSVGCVINYEHCNILQKHRRMFSSAGL